MIPTYNEAENIKKLIPDYLKLIKSIKKHDVSLFFVDDKSPDGTGEIIKEYMKKEKRIKMLSGNKEGLGKAMVRGYLYAIKNLKPDVIITTEADFAYDLNKHLKYMIDKIEEGHDVVVGSRHVPGGFTKGWTLTRKMNHWFANYLFATLIAGVNVVYDHNGAFRAIRVKGVLDSIGLERMKVMGFGFFFYCIYKLTLVTDKFHEFPITYRFRTEGESKVSFNPKYLKSYLRDVREYIKLSFKIRFGSV